MKTVGLDLGTNSIGLSLRNPDRGELLKDQLEYFEVTRFQEGVGKGQSGEYSYAAERTKYRSTRRLYQARKYRIWATLKVLIEYGFCPLLIEDLEKWSKYDKDKGQKRQYPINSKRFEQWVRLDFDGDGTPDYDSPYELRAELMEKHLDFSKEQNRYKLGRALYHIAQRRGFRSSKGETIKEQEQTEKENEPKEEMNIATALKKSEERQSNKLVAYMQQYNLPTVGCAFYHLEKAGVRVRNSDYKAVRTQYKEEIESIFKFQEGLDINGDFYKKITSEKKGEGTIFYKRPLRSQKGLVGKCTLEPQKSRCPISHPEFEKFRAWSFINNISYRASSNDEWKELALDQKHELFDEKFMRLRGSFKFSEIREWIKKKLQLDLSYEGKTINYKDNTSVSGCPVSARLKNILGENWERVEIITNKDHVNHKTGEVHKVSYTAEDLWHVCYSYDEPENVEEFAVRDLKYDENQVKQLVLLYGDIRQGYSTLSLKAIKNINRFLLQGMIYTDAVLLAKLPELFGEEKWRDNESLIVSSISDIIKNNRNNKLICQVVNKLIADYKSLDINEQYAFRNYDYKLDNTDYKDVENALIDVFGEKTWESKNVEDKNDIIGKVAKLYQGFFESKTRDYYKQPKLAEELALFLHDKFEYLDSEKLKLIYHPSMIDYYKPAKEEMIDDGRYVKLLGSPVIGALKNPMAMRMLHTLRKQVNGLLKTIDADGNALVGEDTRVVVETAREMNDANMRWAIEEYQREREKENDRFKEAIERYYPQREYSDSDVDNVRLMIEQSLLLEYENGKVEVEKDKGKKKQESLLDKKYSTNKDKEIEKYRYWIEQGGMCLYTGKTIRISDLFDDNAFDFEHTIPRSISFDNSMANLTVCDAHYNRAIKKNQMPTQLPNYDKNVTIDGVTYTPIKPRLQPWLDKVERLKDNVEYWKTQSKQAQDVGRKNQCIQQKHLWQMELDYWQDKVSRFTMTEVKDGFRHSQLVDTRIITKYAYHYLKTVFNKVEVQKGNVTSDFRKILGIQSVEDKKNRDKHSHHAIDATMLTLVPSSAQRDKMINLFYRKEEEKKLNGESAEWKRLSEQLSLEIRKCGIKGAPEIREFIEENILINHLSKDQVLSPAHKRKRIRGKVVWQRGENGQIIQDENGNQMPERWLTGNSIRGKIHGETFYGAITQGKMDDNGTLLRNEDGSVMVGEQKYYVVRRELKYKKNDKDSGFKSWEDLEKSIVNKSLIEKMKKQFPEGTSFKDACLEGIHMTNSKGEKLNDNIIRHVRCFTSIKNPLVIKKQTYLSSKEYKQYYYAEMGDLYAMCKYQSEDLNEVEYIIYSLFDICENRKHDLSDIPVTIQNKKNTNHLHLRQIIRTGDMLLLYKDNVEELKEMDKHDLSNRLYVVRGFENTGLLIKLVKHINAQKDSELGKGESVKSFDSMPEKIRCGVKTIKFLLSGVDFDLSTNGIKFMV